MRTQWVTLQHILQNAASCMRFAVLFCSSQQLGLLQIRDLRLHLPLS